MKEFVLGMFIIYVECNVVTVTLLWTHRVSLLDCLANSLRVFSQFIAELGQVHLKGKIKTTSNLVLHFSNQLTVHIIAQ